MRRTALLLVSGLLSAPAPAYPQSSVDEFRLGGSAFRLDARCIRLTPDRSFVSGSAWFVRPVELERAFSVEVSVRLGLKDREGADGLVFVLHPSLQTGRAGEGMGFAGMVPSLGVELDTYQNLHLGDPQADHLAFMADGRRRHVAAPVELPNLEDGSRHPLRIEWDPASGLEVTLDGRSVARHANDDVQRIFGASARLYWGFTAGTGRLSNEQDVCIEPMLFAQDRPGSL